MWLVKAYSNLKYSQGNINASQFAYVIPFIALQIDNSAGDVADEQNYLQ